MTQESNSKIKFRQKAVYKIFCQHTFKDSKKLLYRKMSGKKYAKMLTGCLWVVGL